MISEIFDAILLYYGCVLGLSAVTGVRDTLRAGPSASTSPAAVAAASGSSTVAAAAGSGSRWARQGAAFRAGLLGYSGELARTIGWGAGFGAVIGGLLGVDVYRLGRRGIGTGVRWGVAQYRARRTPPTSPSPPRPAADAGGAQPDPADDAATPAPIAAAGPASPPTVPPPQSPAPPTPPPTTPAPTQPIATPPTDAVPPAPAPAPAAAVTAPATANPGERRLFIVKTSVRKEPTMAAGDITGIETLMTWTDNAAGTAEMEAVDAGCTARDAAASVDFCQETAARVAQEVRDLEAGIAVMMALGIDGHTIAAYQRQLEAGHVYYQATVRVAELSEQLSGAATFAQSAANTYREHAEASLATVKRQQLPHLEAAQATGHSSAHGSVYGAADTRSGNPALPRA